MGLYLAEAVVRMSSGHNISQLTDGVVTARQLQH